MTTITKTISPLELRTALEEGCTLVDVREPVEFSGEHIAGAKLIPLGQIEKEAGSMEKKDSLIVMCRSGKRGGEALVKLQAMGFTKIRNLDGGIVAWKEAGLPVSASGRKILPLMQQVQITIGVGVLTGVALSLLVHPAWIYLCAFFGAGLVFAGTTGWCGLAILQSKMPWNRVPGQPARSTGSCAVSK